MDVRKLWDDADEESKYKNVCDVYGAEHLARLIGNPSHLPSTTYILVTNLISSFVA
jgi:hypothetical protein